jgi:hypothetical protein
MHRLSADHAGHRALAAAMTFADHSAVDLERLEAERAAARDADSRVRAPASPAQSDSWGEAA